MENTTIDSPLEGLRGLPVHLDLFAEPTELVDASDAVALMPELAARFGTILRLEEGCTGLPAELVADNRLELLSILEALTGYVVARA